MKYDDLINKLENLKTPDIELPGHKQALKTFLLNSGRFRQRTIMNWAKVLAPVAAAVLLIAVMGVFANNPGTLYLGGNEISKFTSYEQLQNFIKFIKTNAQSQYTASRDSNAGGTPPSFAPLAPSPAESSPGYSTTNIQVAGVDEADIVKTDGNYIYLASGNKTIIVEAYPPQQGRVVSEIELEGTVIGLFINGDRLVVFGEDTPYYPYYDVTRGPTGELPMPLVASPKTFVKVYDISDRENPRLVREISADGQYVGSRMIDDYAYVVVNEPAYEEEGEVNLPAIRVGDNETEIPATDIYYSNVSDYYYTYTTVMAINTQDDDQEPTSETILLGASSNVYVSLSNIYLTFPVWRGNVGDGQATSIYRIQITGDNITYAASGEVPGMVLNQFSMDEYEGYFRVATTTGYVSRTGEGTSRNNIYTLNMALNITGALGNVAPGEKIYSARFMGDRCYLVTFKKVDPLFVIDLSDPHDPAVLGYLKVTGYSDYLQPYDETHIIGIGKETVEAEEGNFAWYQGVKISLFDVSDVNHPVEISKYEIGDRGTDSPILYDHKALLFDKSRNLLVIPVLVAEIDESQYPQGVPSNAYGQPVWQGAYVFNISLSQGIQLRGRITHIENGADLGQWYSYSYSPFSIQRSLYIGDVLYTISNAKIMMSNLDNLDYINEVELAS
jgi:inhibitor of cysteine peptidase